MKLTTFAFSALMALSAPAFADGKKECTCDHACQQACADGKGEKCACKGCDCAKSGHCEHGKCEHDHSKKAAPKKK